MSFRYAAGINKPGYNGLLIPDAPTIGTATAGDASASVTFTPPSGTVTSYTVTSSPGGLTGTGASSPITVSGLTNGTAYTFTVTATNVYGTSPSSSASNSVTPVALLQLWSWGRGLNGQLGLGNTTNYSSPKQIGALNDWLSISASGMVGQSTLAIKTNGTLWSWGDNGFGQLGVGDVVNRSSPVQVGFLTNWLMASGGGYKTSAAIKTDGTLWTWGYNGSGQLGLGNTTAYSSPKQVGSLTDWLYVTVGYTGLAIKSNGTLWSWGKNNFGQTGLGNTGYYSSPKQVGALSNWSKVYNNSQFVIATKTDGTLWGWGQNSLGQLGTNNITYYSSPKQIGALTTWSKVALGSNSFVIGVKTDGTLWSWGQNTAGALGLGNTNNYSSPKQVGSLTDWYIPAAGQSTSGCVKTNGTLWMWGDNQYGQLGLTNVTNYSSPKQVGSATTWSKITAGVYFSIALRS